MAVTLTYTAIMTLALWGVLAIASPFLLTIIILLLRTPCPCK